MQEVEREKQREWKLFPQTVTSVSFSSSLSKPGGLPGFRQLFLHPLLLSHYLSSTPLDSALQFSSSPCPADPLSPVSTPLVDTEPVQCVLGVLCLSTHFGIDSELFRCTVQCLTQPIWAVDRTILVCYSPCASLYMWAVDRTILAFCWLCASLYTCELWTELLWCVVHCMTAHLSYRYRTILVPCSVPLYSFDLTVKELFQCLVQFVPLSLFQQCQ